MADVTPEYRHRSKLGLEVVTSPRNSGVTSPSVYSEWLGGYYLRLVSLLII